MELSNSLRSLSKATYVRLNASAAEDKPGRALQKSAFLRSLSLAPGETDNTLGVPNDGPRLDGDAASLRSLLRQFEGKKLPTELPAPETLAAIPASALLDFGKTLSTERQAVLDEAKARPQQLASITGSSAGISHLYDKVQAVNSALTAFSSELKLSPIGMINLERLDMMPAGLERGELIGAVPLAPRERTTVVQQEWSTISSEFSFHRDRLARELQRDQEGVDARYAEPPGDHLDELDQRELVVDVPHRREPERHGPDAHRLLQHDAQVARLAVPLRSSSHV